MCSGNRGEPIANLQGMAHLIDTQITPLSGVLAPDVHKPFGNAKHRYLFALVA